MTNKEKKLTKALSKAAGTRVDDVRAALAGESLTGHFFSVVTAIDGPYALVALTVDGKMVITAPIPTSKRSLTVDLTSKIKSFPVEIGWGVLAGHKIPQLATFFSKNGSVTKLGSKANLEKGKLWPGQKTVN